jgi:hypothetical protein
MRNVFLVRVYLAASLMTLCFVLPAAVFAQEQPASSPTTLRAAILDSVDAMATPEKRRTESEGPGLPDSPPRPGALLPLYASLGVLQALDVHSTSRGLEAGGREANPVMQPIVRNRAAFIGVKAATTAGVVWASERLWRKQNRKAAIVLTVLTNVGLAAVVAHNYRAAN